jgi:type I restriction enzyme, S subunit
VTTRLADLLQRIETGKSFGSAARSAGTDEWGIVKVSSMTWGEFRPDENKLVSDPSRINPRHEIRPGDVLVSRANTTEYVGAPVLVRHTRPRLLLSDKSLRLIPKAGVDAAYLTTILSAPQTRRRISELATGTKDSMRNISQASLLAVEMPPIPPIEEQRRIVDILEDHLSRLDAADAGMRAVERRTELLDASALAEVWQVAEQSGSRHLVSDFGAVATGSTPSTRSGEVFGSDMPFATPSDIGGGRLIDNVSRGLSTLGAQHARLLAPHTVLAVCIGATLGKIGWTDRELATNQQVNALTPRPDFAIAEFVAALMASPPFQSDMHASASNTTMRILNKSRFSRLTLPVPPVTDQQLLLERLASWRQSIDRLTEAVRASRSRSVGLRRALLQAAFSGHLTGSISDGDRAEESIEV